MKTTINGKKHSWIIREKSKENWQWRGIYWIVNILTIASFFVAAVIFDSELILQIASLITIEYFVGDILIYHTIEKKPRKKEVADKLAANKKKLEKINKRIKELEEKKQRYQNKETALDELAAKTDGLIKKLEMRMKKREEVEKNKE